MRVLFSQRLVRIKLVLFLLLVAAKNNQKNNQRARATLCLKAVVCKLMSGVMDTSTFYTVYGFTGFGQFYHKLDTHVNVLC